MVAVVGGLDRMARLSITIAHGLPPDVAQATFDAAVDETRKRYGRWFDRLDWTRDGHSATVVGAGFEVRCWCDERDLHVEGSVPLTWKLLESALRGKIKREIDRTLLTRN
jgi:hypothetical protein